MSTQDDGGPAFPLTGTEYNQHREEFEVAPIDYGMSLRDYFAAHAPEPPQSWHGGERAVSDVIEWRWHYAALMLNARQQ